MTITQLANVAMVTCKQYKELLSYYKHKDYPLGSQES